MTPKMRNRLVGSIILVIAGVVIIPSVLDGEKISYKDDFKTVPERPEYREVQNDKAFPNNEFDQHIPKPEQDIKDDVALDAQEMTAANDGQVINTQSESSEQPSKQVMSNDTIAVNTISKPVDFDKPIPAKQSKPKAVAPVKQSTVAASKKATVSKPSPFSSSGWVIQLGSFGNKANAAALEKRLNDVGYVTFNRLIKTRAGTLTKVYVGPELDKSLLQKALSRVNKVAGVKGIVTPFSVKR